MKHEDSQTDQRRAAKARAWTEIGEAQITHTLFGKAKVRIILQRDKTRRVSWLLAMLLTMMAAVAWLEWLAPQPTERTEIVDISLPVNDSEQESSVVPLVVHIPPPVALHAQRNPADTAQTESPLTYNNVTKVSAESQADRLPASILANQ